MIIMNRHMFMPEIARCYECLVIIPFTLSGLVLRKMVKLI